MSISAYLVDDDIRSRERMGYIVREFFAGELDIVGESAEPQRALEQIIKQCPEIAFLDVEMPGMTGLELADKLRKKGYKGRIIFVSAHGHYSIKAIKAEAFDYILKPVDVDEFKETIARYRSLSSGAPDPGLVSNFDLSERELELIQHLSKGLSSEQIAEKMFLSRHTIDTHRRNILSKTGTRNTIELLNLLRK